MNVGIHIISQHRYIYIYIVCVCVRERERERERENGEWYVWSCHSAHWHCHGIGWLIMNEKRDTERKCQVDRWNDTSFNHFFIAISTRYYSWICCVDFLRILSKCDICAHIFYHIGYTQWWDSNILETGSILNIGTSRVNQCICVSRTYNFRYSRNRISRIKGDQQNWSDLR